MTPGGGVLGGPPDPPLGFLGGSPGPPSPGGPSAKFSSLAGERLSPATKMGLVHGRQSTTKAFSRRGDSSYSVDSLSPRLDKAWRQCRQSVATPCQGVATVITVVHELKNYLYTLSNFLGRKNVLVCPHTQKSSACVYPCVYSSQAVHYGFTRVTALGVCL